MTACGCEWIWNVIAEMNWDGCGGGLRARRKGRVFADDGESVISAILLPSDFFTSA